MVVHGVMFMDGTFCQDLWTFDSRASLTVTDTKVECLVEIWIIDKWMTLITLMKEESTFILSYSKIIIGIILYLVLFASSGAGSV